MEKEKLKCKRKMEEYEEIDHQVAANYYQYQHEVIMKMPPNNYAYNNNQELGAPVQDQLRADHGHVPHVQYPIWVPPGFVFVPTDSELLSFYLKPKIQNPNNSYVPLILEADIYQQHPQQLLDGIKGNSAYFFTKRTRSYTNGGKQDRTVIEHGYWRMSQGTKPVMESGMQVGEKSGLVFHTGVQSEDKKTSKTNWLMKEYCIPDNEWALCKVYLFK